jgi:hypothetical protein
MHNIRSLALSVLALLAIAACGGPPGVAGDDVATWVDTTSAVSEEDQPNVGQTSQSLTTCGGAGQPCCYGSSCNEGLRCNSNNICRRPCGGLGEPCCSNSVCNTGLGCYSGVCICSFFNNGTGSSCP